MSADYDFLNDASRRIVYDFGDEMGEAVFLPKCPVCGRFVTADKTVSANRDGYFDDEINATCRRDGRVAMPFAGWF